MLPPKYVWFTYSWYRMEWWEKSNGNDSCTPEILRKMLNESLAITPKNSLVSDNRHTVTFSDLVSKYQGLVVLVGGRGGYWPTGEKA